ncbi:biotin--[acetyl-CoA-carboxylase] ligase [[Clostridium] polysaccharolyticum]|nr:biotin--[acetyl-CoA-carboxylase] ligase [[Clostridium] polysaccharolyticum]
MNQIPQAILKTKAIGKKIFYFDEIDSTNLEAKKHKEEVDSNGMVFLAEQQNQGRGRLGRTWVSPKETGIWMSILLKPDFDAQLASQVTLLAALAAADAIRQATKQDCRIKWPNDLVLNGKKVCGILTEMGACDGQVQYMVAGIGINVNTEWFPEEIKETASSLRIEGGIVYSREEIIAELLNSFEVYYDEFCASGSLRSVVNYYNSLLINKGKKVKIVEAVKTDIGIALGIDETGGLKVQTEDGEERTIISGEVSVRGLYGYV